MTTRHPDALLHPIRLRIVLATAGNELTTADIAKRLPDVPQASLYRHIARLAEAGILDVASQRQARGAVEKTYRVNKDRSSINADDAAMMSLQEHLEAFTTFAGILIDTFGRYVNTPGADPALDGVSARQARLWLTPSELDDLATDVGTALAPYLELGEAPGRTPRLLNTIMMPDPIHTDG